MVVCVRIDGFSGIVIYIDGFTGLWCLYVFVCGLFNVKIGPRKGKKEREKHIKNTPGSLPVALTIADLLFV